MSTGMPELGSKISLISKADIRYEGRLFTVDPQECTIALASVRSFGTEDRETQYPVAPQSQVYDYILFRGSDIKDIRVLNNVPSLPNDPAIMQMSVPAAAPYGQFGHPGGQQFAQYHPMAGFPAGVHAALSKTSELPEPAPAPAAGPVGSALPRHSNQVKDQGSMLDLLGGAPQPASRSATPAAALRKSPTSDQGTQVGSAAGARKAAPGAAGPGAPGGARAPRAGSRTRQRYPSGGAPAMPAPPHQPPPHHQQHQQHHQQHQQHHQQHQQHHQSQHQQHHQSQHQPGAAGAGFARGGWRGRARGRGRGFAARNKNTLKFDNDYDFEQANTEFEELRTQLAKTKISDDAAPKIESAACGAEPGAAPAAEADKKDDSGNETGAGEPEQDDDYTGYDKAKSFFDNISCEAVERSKGRSQRTDWRTERKLNSETFGVASARRGAWRGRAAWRHNPHHNPHHQQMAYFGGWRGARGRGRAPGAPRALPAPAPAPAAAAK